LQLERLHLELTGWRTESRKVEQICLKLGGMGVVELAWLVGRLRNTVENVHEVAQCKERD
jgi:hypothetical protein